MVTLESLRIGHPRDFYQLLRSYVPPVAIPTTVLEQHYSQLLSELPSGYAPEVFLESGLDRAKDFTVEEVRSGITRLRNNKALGRSWLSADLLKPLGP
jgi:hypothetical protein